jgi:hypothetical protein
MRYLGFSCEGRPTGAEQLVMVALHNQVQREMARAEKEVGDG